VIVIFQWGKEKWNMCIYISISADRQQTEKEIPKLVISDVLFEDNKS